HPHVSALIDGGQHLVLARPGHRTPRALLRFALRWGRIRHGRHILVVHPCPFKDEFRLDQFSIMTRAFRYPLIIPVLTLPMIRITVFDHIEVDDHISINRRSSWERYVSAHPHVSLVMATGTYDLLFGSAELARLRSLADVNDPVHATSVPALGADLARTEVLITSWGCPPLQESDLDAAPQLQAVLHAAGSARGILPESVYERGIHVVTAADANAVPVAEYTLAAIILAAKRALPRAVANRTAPAGWSETFATPSRTSPARTIGIVGFSRIGRRVVDLLAHVTTGEVLVA